MKLAKSAVVAAALATAGLTTATPVQAQVSTDAQNLLTFIQRVMSHYAILTARSFVDLTYEQLTIEPGTNHLIVSGLKIYPILDWDQEGKCEISIDRAVAGDVYSFETISTGWELSGVTVPNACLDPEVGGMLGSFGYEQIVVDTASIEMSYTLPDSSAEMVIQAAIADALDVSINARFDYLWFNLPIDGYGDPQPIIQLGSAEVAIENRGLYERLEPMVAAQMGDVNAIPQMIQMGLSQMLSEGGSRTPSEVETAFVANLSAEVGRFLTEKNRLVVTAAPEGGVWLDESAFDSPQNLISALRPEVSGIPSAYRKIIPPAEMSAALAAGATPDEATALKIGEALVTGVGAPRSVGDAARLLEPLAANWNGRAAALLAQAHASTGNHEQAYESALIALAAGDLSVLGIADEAEAKLPLQSVLDMQEKVGDDWPGGEEFKSSFEAAISAGDIAQIRKHANATSVGRGLPRSYKASYMLATLAAAGGDRGAANLRDRLDRRFGGDSSWQAAAAEASSVALQVWNGVLGAAIAGRVQ